jgi:hypothetical protein
MFPTLLSGANTWRQWLYACTMQDLAPALRRALKRATGINLKTESFSRTPIDNDKHVKDIVRLVGGKRALLPTAGREAETLLGGVKLLPEVSTHYATGKADFVAAVELIQQMPEPTDRVPNPVPPRAKLAPFIPFTLEEKNERARQSKAAKLAKGHTLAELESAVELLRERAEAGHWEDLDDGDDGGGGGDAGDGGDEMMEDS